jgi:hypothetical protein
LESTPFTRVNRAGRQKLLHPIQSRAAILFCDSSQLSTCLLLQGFDGSPSCEFCLFDFIGHGLVDWMFLGLADHLDRSVDPEYQWIPVGKLRPNEAQELLSFLATQTG